MTVLLREDSKYSTVAGQNVWGRQLGRAKPRGSREKHLKDLGIFIPEIAANASNLTTSSYIWRAHLLLLFSFQLSKIIGGGEGGGGGGAGPPGPSPSNGPEIALA